MKKILSLSLILLSACSPGQGSDGYAFGPKEFDRNEVMVTVRTYNNLAEVQAASAPYAISIENDRELFAFGLVSRSGNTCTIHIVAPEREWRPERLGHEFAHCLYGNWHE